jgi:phosphatidylglycerophosphatase A
MGSLVAWAISLLPGALWQIAAILLFNLAGIPLCTAAGKALGGKKDNQAIIWDEIMSLPIVFLLVPLTNWKIAVAGFALHRLFDITKPPPARQLEHLPEGLGVMADDWVAALYAALALYLLIWAGLPLTG